MSRTKLTILNMTSAFVNKGVTLLIKFGLRTVFIYTLSSVYLGIDNLLSSILMVLSLTDLGLDIALPSRLYAPLKNNDFVKIKQYIDFYKRVYRWVSIIVLALGALMYPFIPYIVHYDPLIENFGVVYALYVTQSAISYIYIYKKTLIIADQKNYIVTNIVCLVQIIMALCQAIILLVWQSFVAYLVCSILFNLFQNVYISRKCDTIYPQLSKFMSSGIPMDEIKRLVKDVTALFTYRVATVLETSVASVLTSYFVGISVLGLASNYMLIIQSLAGILMLVFSSVTPSIGNVIVTKDKDSVYRLYRALNFGTAWIYGIVSICIYCLIQDFISVCWLKQEFLLDMNVVLAMVIAFYIVGSQNMNSTFRNAYGLFWEARYRPFIMILTNILFSYILGSYYGLAGIYWGISISRLISVGIIDPYIVHKYGLEKPVIYYHSDYSKYFLAMMAILSFASFSSKYMAVGSIFIWFIKAILFIVCLNFIYFIIFIKNDNLKYWFQKVKGVLHDA